MKGNAAQPLPIGVERRLEKAAAERDARIESIVSGFERKLHTILGNAQAGLVDELMKRLTFDADGKLEQTPANQVVLRRLKDLWAEQIDEAGYAELVDAYVKQFAGELPQFQNVLDIISDGLEQNGYERLPEVTFTAADKAAFSARQISTADQIEGVAAQAGLLTQRKLLFSVGAVGRRDMLELIGENLGRTATQAKSILDTGISIFYRSIAARGSEHIEATVKGLAFRYKYFGPDDRITRPFCRHLLEAKRVYTRDEISDMDNGQLPDPFVTGGGFNCRHQWLLTVPELSEQSPASPAAASPLKQAA